MSNIDFSDARRKWEMATQPETIDYLRVNGFRFFINGLPNTNYSCQSVSLPGISLGSATQTTPLVDRPMPGDKIVFGDLQVEFIVSEGLVNYYEIWEWMKSLGFPSSHQEFTNLKNVRKNNATFDKTDSRNNTLEYSDAELMILTAANNKIITVRFYDVFPVVLSDIPLAVTTTNSEPTTAAATFKYRSFDLITS